MDQEFPIIQKEHPRVEVTITVMFALPTDNTYRLEWREVSTLANGRVGSDREWAGEFHVELKPPRRLEEAKMNKLGVWVTKMHWAPRVLPGGA
jgi:type IV secretory pathway TrbF-like protein